MKNPVISQIVLSVFILVCILCCKNSPDVVPMQSGEDTTQPETESMQPYAGYPLLDNTDSIKHMLSSRCLDSINFNNGEIVADIGAGNGYLEGMLSLFFDGMTFYIQDIDTSICNQSAVNKVADFYKGLKNKPFNNNFIAINGTDSTTNLPDNICDKILMLYTYQYIRKPKAFILDVRKKLKNDGLFYVVNPQYGDYNDLDFQRKKYGWNASPLENEISDIISCGFELTRISRRIDDYDNPYMMVFKKK
jgi:SAM-dependent methyltransferase